MWVYFGSLIFSMFLPDYKRINYHKNLGVIQKYISQSSPINRLMLRALLINCWPHLTLRKPLVWGRMKNEYRVSQTNFFSFTIITQNKPIKTLKHNKFQPCTISRPKRENASHWKYHTNLACTRQLGLRQATQETTAYSRRSLSLPEIPELIFKNQSCPVPPISFILLLFVHFFLKLNILWIFPIKPFSYKEVSLASGRLTELDHQVKKCTKSHFVGMIEKFHHLRICDQNNKKKDNHKKKNSVEMCHYQVVFLLLTVILISKIVKSHVSSFNTYSRKHYWTETLRILQNSPPSQISRSNLSYFFSFLYSFSRISLVFLFWVSFSSFLLISSCNYLSTHIKFSAVVLLFKNQMEYLSLNNYMIMGLFCMRIIIYHFKKNLLNCLQLFGTVTVHQILVESLLKNGWSNNRSFLGFSACQLQAVEQVFFEVYGATFPVLGIGEIIYFVTMSKNHSGQFYGQGQEFRLLTGGCTKSQRWLQDHNKPSKIQPQNIKIGFTILYICKIDSIKNLKASTRARMCLERISRMKGFFHSYIPAEIVEVFSQIWKPLTDPDMDFIFWISRSLQNPHHVTAKKGELVQVGCRIHTHYTKILKMRFSFINFFGDQIGTNLMIIIFFLKSGLNLTMAQFNLDLGQHNPKLTHLPNSMQLFFAYSLNFVIFISL
ncbi:hypothetical protein VP01_203g4 [Puccinia sorghi]|uniref:Uncharacterized protein n=1 Tax=Puccinia sorghi TaxID=27349 RepID=A0A0L6VAV5_9BASI|nr:hypothetical protein VP01_203g4 [Puccinia sorghi]